MEDCTNEEIKVQDLYLLMELELSWCDEELILYNCVKGSSLDEERKPIVVASNNPLLDHRKYGVDYIDRKLIL